jgi:hypothetical protein
LNAIAIALLLSQASAAAPEWDLKPRIGKLSEEVGRIKPLIEGLDPAKWAAGGAPEAYARQWRHCLDTADHVLNAATRFAAQTERLPLVLETLFRVDGFLEQTASLTQGARKYQNPALADLIEAQANGIAAHREWLRQHAQELANTIQTELEVAEKEAQRCRTQLFRPGARRP